MSPAPLPGRTKPVFLRTTAPTPAQAPVAERFHACVRNTGNYFFEESLLRHLPGIDVFDSLETLPRQIGTLVLSMSNFISPSTDLGYLHDALAARRIDQVVMVGAGAQAYRYSDCVRLTDGTRRFLGYVADRSVSIGVRGYYTAEILERLGIHNVSVIGCPSAFWSGQVPGPGLRRCGKPARLAVHSTPIGHFRDKVSALLSHGMRHGADYVMQSEAWMMPLLREGGDDAALEEGLLYYGYPECDPAALRTWLERNLHVFFGVREWLERMEGYDFVYGSRFHGNMAAIQAGVPALNMPFDTRTRELCEYLNLPTLPLLDFEAGMPVQQLREMADFSLFTRTFPRKLRDYAEFLARSGLPHALTDLEGPACEDRESRVKARSVAQLLCDAHMFKADAGFSLAAKLAQRLRPDRPEAARRAADIGLINAIDPVPHPALIPDNQLDEWLGQAPRPAPGPAAALHGPPAIPPGPALHPRATDLAQSGIVLH